MLHTDAWLLPRPAPQNITVIQDNDLPGNTSSGHSHQDALLWDAPGGFLGNKVRPQTAVPCPVPPPPPVSLAVSSQLGSYGGFLNYSLLYDIPLDNEDRSIPAHSDVIVKVTGKCFLSPDGT